MIDVPENYVKKIIEQYGEKGYDWLKQIDFLLQKYKNKFEIDQLNYFNHSRNLLFEGYSNKLQKSVILKLGLPYYNAQNEANMLKKYGDLACQCFYENNDDRVLVLEKLTPRK